jgi:hypothetical protein
MNNVIYNPKDYIAQYIEYLNICFPNWGGRELYDWVYKREIGPHKPDFIILTNEDDEVIAGSGITYRNIKTKSGIVLKIGVFTGSWTLPNARGRGCFTQIIEEFTKLCTDKKIDFLTAFVTESNASYRRFESIGFQHFQADNVFSNLDFDYSNFGLEVRKIACNPKAIYSVYEDFMEQNAGYYYSFEEFSGQYLQRKLEVQVLQIEDTIFVAEENESTFRILYYSAFNVQHLMAFSDWVNKEKQKKVMFFLTDKSQIEFCRINNFSIAPSFLTFQQTSSNVLANDSTFNSFAINLADKM